MKIQSIDLENYKIFKGNHEITFDEKVTVFAGINGIGKTTVLSLVNILLSTYVNKLTNQPKHNLKDNDITLNTNNTWATINIQECFQDKECKNYTYTISRKRSKTIPITPAISHSNPLAGLNQLIKDINDHEIIKTFFAYYSTKRIITDSIKQRHTKKYEYQWEDAFKDVENGGSISNFRAFFNWFAYHQEDQNALDSKQLAEVKKITDKFDEAFIEIVTTEDHNQAYDFEAKRNQYLEYRQEYFNIMKKHEETNIKQLSCVRNAITMFLPGYSKLRISRRPIRMEINKGNETFNIDALSDGEKCYIALIGDIARRLSILNKNLEDPLQGEGIILIDEIELHLHVEWQRNIIERLTTVFPNCQFILTTHSPHVLGELQENQVYVIKENQEQRTVHLERLSTTYGRSSNYLSKAIGGRANSKIYETLITELQNPHLTDDEFKNKIQEFQDQFPNDDHTISDVRITRELREL